MNLYRVIAVYLLHIIFRMNGGLYTAALSLFQVNMHDISWYFIQWENLSYFLYLRLRSSVVHLHLHYVQFYRVMSACVICISTCKAAVTISLTLVTWFIKFNWQMHLSFDNFWQNTLHFTFPCCLTLFNLSVCTQHWLSCCKFDEYLRIRFCPQIMHPANIANCVMCLSHNLHV